MNVMVFAAALLGASGQVYSQDCVVRVAYPDRERPPYYMGNGPTVPAAPGAAAELLRLALRNTGCSVELSRLPPARIRLALVSGNIDFALVDLRDGEQPYSALPLTAAGLPDPRRGMRLSNVVYVRTADELPPQTNPRDYFRTHTLASNQGAAVVEQLREEGYKVDDGAPDAYSNMEKVAMKRADGFIVGVANTVAVDAVVSARYGDTLKRLSTPMRISTVWLSASKVYYGQHGAQAEAVWNWWGEHATRKLAELVKQYTPPR